MISLNPLSWFRRTQNTNSREHGENPREHGVLVEYPHRGFHFPGDPGDAESHGPRFHDRYNQLDVRCWPDTKLNRFLERYSWGVKLLRRQAVKRGAAIPIVGGGFIPAPSLAARTKAAEHYVADLSVTDQHCTRAPYSWGDEPNGCTPEMQAEAEARPWPVPSELLGTTVKIEAGQAAQDMQQIYESERHNFLADRDRFEGKTDP